MANLDESLKKLQTLQKRPDGVTSNEWRTIQKGIGELRKRQEFDPKQHKAQTQSDLAKMFIKWYFAILVIILVYVPIYNWSATHLFGESGEEALISVRDAFLMVSGAVTPLLAFVLGHYFKGRD